MFEDAGNFCTHQQELEVVNLSVTTMMFFDKVEAFLREAEAEGIPRWNVAPPVYRMFWWFGIEVPPPSFLSRSFVVALEGLFFSIAFFLFFFQFFKPAEAMFCALGTGVMYGLIAGIQHLDMAYQLGSLPNWDLYIPGIGVSGE